jgi:serine/threonine-protein kinase
MAGGTALQTGSMRLAVLGKLGSGGMATVLLGRIEDDPTRLVAIKRMHRHLLLDGDTLRMFLDEIWMTERLDHPNLVRLVGWGVDQDGPYLVTELVRGASLGTLARLAHADGEALPHTVVAHVAAEVARGLAAAHALEGADGTSLGLVHRDLTPSNVLIGFDGAVKVSDFGVAKATKKIGHTKTGMLVGKRMYLAPEYIRGDSIDARCDLFSIGMMMYVLIAGEPPFTGLDANMLLRAMALENAPAIATKAEVNGELGEIVDCLVANDPAHRLSSAEELADTLDDWLARRGHTADQEREQMSEFAKRHGQAADGQVKKLLSGVQSESTPVKVITASSGRSSSPSSSGASDTFVTAPTARAETPPSLLERDVPPEQQRARDTRVVARPGETPAPTSAPQTRPSKPPESVTRPSAPPPASAVPPTVQAAPTPAQAATMQSEAPLLQRLSEAPAAPSAGAGASNRVWLIVAGATLIGALGGAGLMALAADDDPKPVPRAQPTTEPFPEPPPPEKTGVVEHPTPIPPPVGTSAKPPPPPPPPPAPPPVPRKPRKPRKSCTPTDFDYPQCLKR